MHSSKRAITRRELDILCGVLRPYITPSVSSVKSSPPKVISLPSYGHFLRHPCGEDMSLSIVNTPQGMIRARAPEYSYTVAISNDFLSVSWRLNHSEGILERVKMATLPPKTHYEIRLHGNSFLFLLELSNSKIFTNKSPIGLALTGNSINTDRSSVEFYMEKEPFIQDFHACPETKTYVSMGRASVIWLDDQKLMINEAAVSGIITVNPEIPHSVIAKSESPLFTITAENPRRQSKTPKSIMVTKEEIREALRL